jgi:hypothetical protein
VIRLRTVAVLILSLAAMSGQGQPSGQAPTVSAKTWVGNHQEIEEYLRTAECVTLTTAGSSPLVRCTFKPGGPVARMAWRPLLPGVHRGFFENYKSEIAAYELDKLLKMDMVPPTVERQLEGTKGAAQQWVENIVDGTDPTPPPEEIKARWEDQLLRMTMFDNLIGNGSRNRQNMLRDRAWNLILIDFSRAFGADTVLHAKLNRIDEALWAKISGLTRRQLDSALQAWLSEQEIKAILDRREAMKAAITALPK